MLPATEVLLFLQLHLVIILVSSVPSARRRGTIRTGVWHRCPVQSIPSVLLGKSFPVLFAELISMSLDEVWKLPFAPRGIGALLKLRKRSSRQRHILHKHERVDVDFLLPQILFDLRESAGLSVFSPFGVSDSPTQSVNISVANLPDRTGNGQRATQL